MHNNKISFKIGVVLATAHFIVGSFFVYNILRWSVNAQWQLLWFLPFTIDFPISLLYVFIISLPFFNFSVSFLPYPIGEIKSFMMPCLMHIILGTLWYFYLPRLIVLLAKKVKRRKH